jgi:acyl-CoA thioester hydrolase
MAPMQPAPAPTAVHVHRLIAADDDIDELGHVSNVVYVRWVLEAALGHSAAVGWGAAEYLELGSTFVVRRHEIDYLLPVFAGEAVEVETRVDWWKGATSLRRTSIRRASDGTEVARGATLWAFVDMKVGRPRRIPESVRTAFGLAASAA